MAVRRTKQRRRPSKSQGKSQGKSEVTVHITFRVLIEQKGIIDRMAADLVAKNPHLDRTDVIQELMGMTRTGFISQELRDHFFEECERARKEERERKENRRRKLKLPTSDNDKTGYIHAPDTAIFAYSLPTDAPLRLVKLDEEEADPIILTGD